MLTGNSQGICTKQKTIKLLGKFTILLYDHRNAPLEIIQCAKLGACAIGWPPFPTARTSGDYDKAWREKWEQVGTLHLGSQKGSDKSCLKKQRYNSGQFYIVLSLDFCPHKFCHY